MKKGIVYLLLAIFLLFVAENKHRVDFQENFGDQYIPTSTFAFAKKHNITETVNKISVSQSNDSLDYSEEIDADGFSFSNAFTAIAITSIFGLSFLLDLFFRHKKQIFHNLEIFSHSVKRFILLRTIRI